jgi:hypothetical protein
MTDPDKPKPKKRKRIGPSCSLCDYTEGSEICQYCSVHAQMNQPIEPDYEDPRDYL